MYTYRFGGSAGVERSLDDREELIVVRTRRRAPLETTPLSVNARTVTSRLERIVTFPAAGVEVYKPRAQTYDEARTTLAAEAEVRFAGRCLSDPGTREPVLYTENFFVKFQDDMGVNECEKTLRDHSLRIKRKLRYSRNAYFVAAAEGTGRAVFDIANELLDKGWVELCHPELIREARGREAFTEQWHLHQVTIGGREINAHANVEAAWSITEGEGVVIAVVDDGVDIDHEEFRRPGKIVAPRDVTMDTANPRPGFGDRHGTACAGVACGDGLHHASGVAPRARLMPIRLASGLGSIAEADAFFWAAENGADIISCSWGPRDGEWWNDEDPLHHQVVPLPDSTRLAIDWATDNGRNGRGCVITWAAGNGNEPVDNDGYASYGRVIAVAACNDQSRKSAYSDHGDAIWCSFPSSHGAPSLTSGIWTTDRSGTQGYNPGTPGLGDADGNYTNNFGGTSSACPGAAGVAALILARNPDLRWDEVKAVIRSTCDRIDEANGEYAASGENVGHSPLYGYGRVDARAAVEAAMPAQPAYTVIHKVIQDVAIQDFARSKLSVEVGDADKIKDVRIGVDIEHTYIGDLIVRIIPPAQMGGPQAVILHNRSGGGTAHLKAQFDTTNVPELEQLKDLPPKGRWQLEVDDAAGEDVGNIRSFYVELIY